MKIRKQVWLLVIVALLLPLQISTAKKKKETNDRELWAGVLYRMAAPVLSSMSEGKLQENKDERRRIVDARDLLRCQRLADDGRVADRVDLLQQVRNNDWERKRQNRLPAFALRELHRLEEGR